MQYLFFDIECSDGIHICSFGYCLTDENFKVIKKEDIVINPESRFILSKNKKRPKINLAYSEEYFNSKQNFSYYYPKIKKILTQKNQVICGHSILSDFHFLLNACNRYNLQHLDLKGFDIQKLYQIYFKEMHVQSLENILIDLKINIDKIKFHKSCDDAYATMLVAKEVCKKNKSNFSTVINSHQECVVDSTNIKLKNKIYSFKNEIIKLRNELCKERKRTVAFSEDFKTFGKEKQIEIIKTLFMKGYDFTTKIAECNLFVKGKYVGAREKFCDKLNSNGTKIEKMTFKNFCRMINNKSKVIDKYANKEDNNKVLIKTM